jgi:hypothetical protein
MPLLTGEGSPGSAFDHRLPLNDAPIAYQGFKPTRWLVKVL